MSNCSIFTTNNRMLRLTYVKRREFYDPLVDLLEPEENNLILITGMSKSGKSMLVGRAVEELYEKPRVLEFQGDALKDKENNLIAAIASRLKIRQEKNYRWETTQWLKENEACIIIDDFHFIESREVREAILREIRSLLNEGEGLINIVIIGVSSPRMTEVGRLPDLNGRTRELILKNWTLQDIKRIGSLGFDKVHVDIENLDSIAQESFGTPFIMQRLCANYCKVIDEKRKGVKQFYPTKIMPHELKRIAADVAASLRPEIYEFLVSEETCQIKRHVRLNDGSYATFNYAFWSAVVGEYFNGEMPYWPSVELLKLRHRLQDKVLHPSEPAIDLETLRQRVRYMVSHYYRYYEEYGAAYDPIVGLSMNDTRLIVTDPFMLFYARHGAQDFRFYE